MVFELHFYFTPVILCIINLFCISCRCLQFFSGVNTVTSAFSLIGDEWSHANWRVAQRLVANFAPRAQSPANMTVIIDPGALLNGGVLVERGLQTTAAFSRPTTIRVDRIVINRNDGAILVVAGSDGSLTPPAIPTNYYPCAQVILHSTTTSIDGDAIIDERVFSDSKNYQPEQVVCRAHRTTDQTGIVNGALQKVNFTNTSINIGSAFNTTTSVFQPTVPGLYNVFLQCTFNLASGNVQLNAAIRLNGTTVARSEVGPGAISLQCVAISDIIEMNGTTDYLDFYTAQASGGTLSLYSSNQFTYMYANKIG